MQNHKGALEKSADLNVASPADADADTLCPTHKVYCIRIYDARGVVACVSLRNVLLMFAGSTALWLAIYLALR